jgi:hypothetical protein
MRFDYADRYLRVSRIDIHSELSSVTPVPKRFKGIATESYRECSRCFSRTFFEVTVVTSDADVKHLAMCEGCKRLVELQ